MISFHNLQDIRTCNFRKIRVHSNSNSTFIALNLYLMIDSKTQKAKIRDRNLKSGTLQGSTPRRDKMRN